MSMAIKTIVCPECQALAAPGRYACAKCGALLASVAVSARTYGGSAAGTLPGEPGGDAVVDDHRSSAPLVAPAWTHSLAAEPEEEALPEAGEEERWDDELAISGEVAGTELPVPESVAPVAELASSAVADAPVAELVAAPKPSRIIRPTAKPRTKSGARTPRRPDPAALESIAPLTELVGDADPAPPAWPVDIATPEPPLVAIEAAPSAEPGPLVAPAEPVAADQPVVAPERLAPAQFAPAWAVAAAQPVAPPAQPVAPADVQPAWPPPGDQGVIVEPFARVPAGSYLPPSAVLASGDAISAAAPIDARSPGPALRPGPTETGAASPRPSAADRLAQLGLPADTPRRVVGIGAVVAALGFLLPWAPVLAGSGLLGGYWTQWGLAGPGHWIVALLLVGLAVLSLAGGRLATVAVGQAAVAVATLLAGLSWPYLFGFLGRAVGIWVVLFGAILLVSGGLLDLRAGRHGQPDSTV
jgi:hypothetical protein